MLLKILSFLEDQIAYNYFHEERSLKVISEDGKGL